MPPKSRNIPKPRTAQNVLAAQAHTKLLQAVEFHQKGQLAQAQAIYEDVLEIQPKNFHALHLLGVIASQTGEQQRAVDLIGKAIEIHPNDAAYYSNRGNAFKALKQLEAAVASYDKAIALKPDYAEAYSNRGLALHGLQQLGAAVVSYDKAIALKPDYAEAYSNCGSVLKELKNLDASIAYCDKAIALNPQLAEAYCNRGCVLQELKRLDTAVASYNQAIAIKPDFAEAYCNRGNALQELQQLDAALASYDQAIALKPDFAEAYSNRGKMLQDLQRLDAAVASYNQAIAFQPDLEEAHWNKALALLLGGHFDEGWELYEWRWMRKGIAEAKRDFPQPLWLGEESLIGKTILLHSEQGLGDTLQFCRYAKLVANLGARVILEVEQPLVGLLKELKGVAGLAVKGTELSAFDFHCPLPSLPLAFNTNVSNIPCAPAYLSTDSSKVAHWAGRLGEKTKPRVGLAWSGNTEHINDRNRSLVLSELVTQLPEGFQYVSLQREVRDSDRPTLQAHVNLKHYGEELKDFTDTAALVDLMDLVISVDTSVAHLSGALGKPTWILLPYCPDWRWMLDRDNSPWYPSVKLYRQEKIGDWAGVIARVKADLATVPCLQAILEELL